MRPTPPDPEPAAHLFDQTNGVLGEDTDDTDHGEDQASGSHRFGIPPIVSL
ncbi:MAG: hypothetical protein HIU86_07290 [Acidobacteria bacterium]|nr:hypothetical protein [Acidobacteriota bacterium]